MDDATRARALVAGQFLTLIALALPDRSASRMRGDESRPRSRPRARRRAAGWGVILGGGALAGAAAVALGTDLRPLPLPRPGVTLRTAGPYALARHPIYAGILLAAVGRTLTTGGRRHAAATLTLGAIFRTKARFEERLLTDVVDYSPYRESVPRWGLPGSARTR